MADIEIKATTEAGVKAGAEAQVSGVPGFATWTEQQGLDWIDANIGDTPIDAITNLAEAKALMKKQATAFAALWRFAVAFRNQIFPNLQDNG